MKLIRAFALLAEILAGLYAMRRVGWRTRVGGRLEIAFKTLLGVLIPVMCSL